MGAGEGGRGCGTLKASLRAAAMGQTAPKVNAERPWCVAGWGRHWALGDGSRCRQRHKEDWEEEGILH